MNDFDITQVFESMPDTYSMHLKCPEIALHTYRKINKVELAHKVLKKKRVYLDTMYWVRIRDVILGRNTQTAYEELYHELKKACASGALLCPVSFSAMTEMLSQEDMETRLTTARLMDELSGGVCLERPDYLFLNEVDYFLGQSVVPDSYQYNPSDLAWTRAAFFVGQPTLSADALSEQQEVAMQKCMDDGMSSLSIETLVNGLGKNPKLKSGERHDHMKNLTKKTANDLNSEKSKDGNTFPDYQQYVQSEVIGIVDSMRSILGPVMERVMRKTGYSGESGETEMALCAESLKRVIANAYEHGKIGSKLPQLHIWASLHALVRYDRKRNYKGTDFEDFRHAGSAIPYCDVFLTEKSLSHMLKHPPASIEGQFNCAVFANPSDALPFMKSFLAEVD